jgi:large subunit ribosomal protein L13
LLERAPARGVQRAVKGMLPRNPLGRAMCKNLNVYSGSEHPHTAQQPEALNI